MVKGLAEFIIRDNFVICIAAMGGFLVGYDFGSISNAGDCFGSQWDLSTLQLNFLIPVTVVSAALGSSLTGVDLLVNLGRKPLLLGACFLMICGAAVTAASLNYYEIMIGRVLVGMASGAFYGVGPLFISEISKVRERGRSGIKFAIMQDAAVAVSGLLSAFFMSYTGGWRYIYIIFCCITALVFVFFLALPESPRFLAMKGMDDDALLILTALRVHSTSPADIKAELGTMFEGNLPPLALIPVITDETVANVTDSIQYSTHGRLAPPSSFIRRRSSRGSRTSNPASISASGSRSGKFLINYDEAEEDVLSPLPEDRAVVELELGQVSSAGLGAGHGPGGGSGSGGESWKRSGRLILIRVNPRDSRDIPPSASLSLKERTEIDRQQKLGLYQRLKESRGLRLELMIGCGLWFLNQFSGVEPVIFNGSSIVSSAMGGSMSSYLYLGGLKISTDLLLVAPIQGLAILGMLVSGRTIDNPGGRRRTLLISVGGIALSLFALAVGLQENVNMLSLVGLAAFQYYIGYGLGAMPFIVNSGIYPPDIRPQCQGLAHVIYWFSLCTVSSSYTPLADSIGATTLFYFYGVVLIFGFIWLYFMFPATLGVDELEQKGAPFIKKSMEAKQSISDVRMLLIGGRNGYSESTGPGAGLGNGRLNTTAAEHLVGTVEERRGVS